MGFVLIHRFAERRTKCRFQGTYDPGCGSQIRASCAEAEHEIEMVGTWQRVLGAVLLGAAVLGGFGQAAQSAPATGPASALRAYLSRADEARQPYVRAAPAVEAALNAVSNTPDATWLTAAQKVTTSQHAAEHLATALASIKPPSGLRRANSQFHQAAVVAAQYLKELASGLAAKDVSAVQASLDSFAQAQTRINALNNGWKTAVISAAHKAGVKIPSWVTALGNA